MAEPLTIQQAKTFLRVDGSLEDEVISSAIVEARGWIEWYTGILLTRRSVQEVLPSFSRKLRSWPIVAVDSVHYVDLTGQEQLLPSSAYYAQIAARPASLAASSWPRVMAGGRVKIALTAGFASAEEINDFSPVLMRTLKELVTGYYTDRGTGGLAAELEARAKDHCRPFRLVRV